MREKSTIYAYNQVSLFLFQTSSLWSPIFASIDLVLDLRPGIVSFILENIVFP